MAKSKLSKKTKKVIKENTLVSIVIASFLINLFFFTGLVIYNSTTQIDLGLYNSTRNEFCTDGYTDYLQDVKATAGNIEFEKAMLDVTCVKGEFKPYHDQAVEEYLQDLGY